MTIPATGLADIRATIEDHQLMPADCQAVFVGGSMARGWAHARSDADLYIVSVAPWTGATNGFSPVALDPDSVPTNVTYIDGRRWEVRYWLEAQVDQMLAKADWENFHGTDSTGRRLSPHEALFLSRLDGALVVIGAEWMRHRRQQVADSAFRSMFTLRALADADSWVEDALGMLESGDMHAAVLAAQGALAASADALTLNHGEYSVEQKWRARRVQAVDSSLLPFDRYWAMATMMTFDPEHPEEWIRSVLELSRKVALEVEV
jgi:hypothetical protein